jgi:hypothetical protein
MQKYIVSEEIVATILMVEKFRKGEAVLKLTTLHGATSKKMRHFIGASVKTSTSKQDNRIYISNKKET